MLPINQFPGVISHLLLVLLLLLRQSYVKDFEGVGLCTVNLVDDMHEYMRGLFITM